MKVGKVSETILKRSIFKQIHTKRDEVLLGAGVGEDCAAMKLAPGEIFVISTDPITGTVKDIGTLAIQITANDLASSGAEPVGVMLTVLLPEEIEESAKVDGATEWQLFRKIVLPLVAPGIAAVAMLSFMYAWNEYTYTVIFTRTPANNTVPLALSLLNTEDNLTNFGLVAAGGVVSVIPITLFVIFAQNYLISGLSSGAVKE